DGKRSKPSTKSDQTRAIRKEKSVRKTIEQHKAMCVHRIARVRQRDSFAGVKQRSVFGGRPSLQRISLSIV
ncbi:hypothetical protein, partial [Ruminococcus sp.]|uniref:hypothetical protein n=1 Tax=Ruminococcus sp. TaxID=41978 RepID=UPI0025D9D320